MVRNKVSAAYGAIPDGWREAGRRRNRLANAGGRRTDIRIDT